MTIEKIIEELSKVEGLGEANHLNHLLAEAINVEIVQSKKHKHINCVFDLLCMFTDSYKTHNREMNDQIKQFITTAWNYHDFDSEYADTIIGIAFFLDKDDCISFLEDRRSKSNPTLVSLLNEAIKEKNKE